MHDTSNIYYLGEKPLILPAFFQGPQVITWCKISRQERWMLVQVLGYLSISYNRKNLAYHMETNDNVVYSSI